MTVVPIIPPQTARPVAQTVNPRTAPASSPQSAAAPQGDAAGKKTPSGVQGVPAVASAKRIDPAAPPAPFPGGTPSAKAEKGRKACGSLRPSGAPRSRGRTFRSVGSRCCPGRPSPSAHRGPLHSGGEAGFVLRQRRQGSAPGRSLYRRHGIRTCPHLAAFRSGPPAGTPRSAARGRAFGFRCSRLACGEPRSRPCGNRGPIRRAVQACRKRQGRGRRLQGCPQGRAFRPFR